MKKLSLFFSLIIISLVISCSNSGKPDNKVEETVKDVVLSQSELIIGKWKTNEGVVYEFLPNGSIINHKKNSTGKWNISEEILSITFPLDYEQLYKVIEITSTSYKIQSYKENKDIITATKVE